MQARFFHSVGTRPSSSAGMSPDMHQHDALSAVVEQSAQPLASPQSGHRLAAQAGAEWDAIGLVFIECE